MWDRLDSASRRRWRRRSAVAIGAVIDGDESAFVLEKLVGVVAKFKSRDAIDGSRTGGSIGGNPRESSEMGGIGNPCARLDLFICETASFGLSVHEDDFGIGDEDDLAA